MTVGVDTKVVIPNITIETPDRRFWKAVGIELAKDIVKRTDAGKDADNRPFLAYEKSTKASRARKGRSQRVNLTDTGRMLRSVPNGVRSRKDGVKITLRGESGMKAWNIQNRLKRKRVFFAMNEKQVLKIIKTIKAWIKRKNK